MSLAVFRGSYRLLLLLPLLVVGVRSSFGQAAPVPITSTFDVDSEGWQTAFINQQRNPPVPEHVAAGGNPGGYIRATDRLDGPQWYWVAPAKFLGDRSSTYGYQLEFDQTTTDIRNPITTLPSVILTGAGQSIAYPTSVLPTQQWTRISIRLDESAGWSIRNNDGTLGAAASAADILKVLTALSGVYIRAEYNYGPDVNALDNVVLGGQPAQTVFLPIVNR